jgi:hypothetical protein
MLTGLATLGAKEFHHSWGLCHYEKLVVWHPLITWQYETSSHLVEINCHHYPKET